MTIKRTTLAASLAITFFLTLLQANSYAAEPTKPYIINLHDIINSKHYPQKLKDNPVEGKVIVSIWLDEEGNMLKYRIDEANNDDLEEYIKGRLPLLDFEPARDSFGTRVFSKIKLPFEFKKEE